MKTLSIFFLLAISSSALAAPQCWVNSASGHTDLTIDAARVQVGAPFGEISIYSTPKGYSLNYTFNGISTSVDFKKKVSIGKSAEIPGKSYNENLGNIACI